MKMIGSDFDGTIPTNKVILDSTREKIKKFREDGNLFVIVTGRSPKVFCQGIKNYEIDFFDYVICANGAVTMSQDLEYKELNEMKRETIQQITALLLQQSDPKEIYINTIKESILIAQGKDIDQIQDPMISMSLKFDTIEQRKQYDFQSIPGIDVFSNFVYTDIVPVGISKASKLLALYDQLHGDRLFTIGDGDNDRCMLECCEDSYTFAHVEDSVKKSAKRIMNTIDDILDDINDR